MKDYADSIRPAAVPRTSWRTLSPKELFPEVFAEGKIDFDALKQLLGEYVDDANERYSFTWNGKSQDSRSIAQLRRDLQAETQFNRQVELNMRIKAAEKELAAAVGEGCDGWRPLVCY